MDNLRQAAGIGKPKVQAAVEAGMGKKLGRVEGKKGGIYRLRNDGPVRDSPSQSATSRTADSDSSRESALRPPFRGPDRDQLSDAGAGAASQRNGLRGSPKQHWTEQASEMANGVDAAAPATNGRTAGRFREGVPPSAKGKPTRPLPIFDVRKGESDEQAEARWYAAEGAQRVAASDRAEAERLKRLGQLEEAKKFEESAAEAEKRAVSL